MNGSHEHQGLLLVVAGSDRIWTTPHTEFQLSPPLHRWVCEVHTVHALNIPANSPMYLFLLPPPKTGLFPPVYLQTSHFGADWVPNQPVKERRQASLILRGGIGDITVHLHGRPGESLLSALAALADSDSIFSQNQRYCPTSLCTVRWAWKIGKENDFNEHCRTTPVAFRWDDPQSLSMLQWHQTLRPVQSTTHEENETDGFVV